MFSFFHSFLKPHDIWNAARRGDLETIQKLIDSGVDVNAKKRTLTVTGWTPIHYAAYYGQANAIRALVKAGGKINARDDEGDTPMSLAVGNRTSTELIDVLMEVGAEIDRGATSPLQMAASSGNEQMVRHLISRGADPRESANKSVGGPLWSAIASRNGAIVQMLLKAGAEVNAGHEKENALDAAALHGLLDITRMLLDAGADPNHRDSQGQTPLMSAVFSKRPEIVEMLLGAGADINAKSLDERTALDRAEREKLSDIVSMLKRAGAKHGREI
jgi:ankyrin repeat protein